jgi:hypothetical protein
LAYLNNQNAVLTQNAGSPLDVVIYGGAQSAAVNLTSTTTTQLVASPATGTQIRIHSISIFGNTATQTVRFAVGAVPFATLAIGTPPAALVLNGLLTSSAINVTSSAVTSIFAYVFYDIVALPNIY